MITGERTQTRRKNLRRNVKCNDVEPTDSAPKQAKAFKHHTSSILPELDVV